MTKLAPRCNCFSCFLMSLLDALLSTLPLSLSESEEELKLLGGLLQACCGGW